ncbi:MAG: type II toxin-antitoxin system death-on-curing family toxin [bacterium]
MKIITVSDVELIAHKLAQEALSFNEPIPGFDTRFPNVLESCLLTPFQTFGRKSLYKGLLGKASILFYLMIKKRPFKNGNKRIAVTALLSFLYFNDRWLKANIEELYSFAMWIAESPSGSKEGTLLAIESFLRQYVIAKK